ncbi:hypothetical protein [Pectobacterium carotovorum]|uniref:hypothetical protein n=1 Tax=Pectobacterium carotovorum TaxID=554 RepID=UPI002E2B0C9A|nr:hypothetical protein [Pectobacterium carotovorum]
MTRAHRHTPSAAPAHPLHARYAAPSGGQGRHTGTSPLAHYPAQDCSADHEPEGADWVGDDGTLTLAGDWLTLSGLLGQSLRIEGLPGKITIRAEQGTMLA